jgi:hypothetical protein
MTTVKTRSNCHSYSSIGKTARRERRALDESMNRTNVDSNAARSLFELEVLILLKNH